MTTTALSVLSSMATKQLLADLALPFQTRHAQSVRVESVGGVDAAKRVQAGEAVDVVVLAANAIDALVASGKLVARVDLVRSVTAVAVRAAAQQPPIATEDDVKRAVLAASSLSYSTGPSGVQLAKLFERWGIAQQLQSRIVQAPPGVPVGSLVASGQVELGFQQLSELVGLPGIAVLGALPTPIEIITTFSAAVSVSSAQPEAAQALLAFMASPDVSSIKLRNGMEPM